MFARTNIPLKHHKTTREGKKCILSFSPIFFLVGCLLYSEYNTFYMEEEIKAGMNRFVIRTKTTTCLNDIERPVTVTVPV